MLSKRKSTTENVFLDNKDKENECEAYSRKLHINVCDILLKRVNEI